MTPQAPLLSMRGVAKTFGAVRALTGVDLDVAAGEVHALIGENGAGKSTLMKVLSGAVRPDSGAMTLAGEQYAPRSPRTARARGVAMIYQELAIAPHLSVESNILLGRERARAGFVRTRAHRRIAREALAELGHGDIDPDAKAGQLPLASRQLIEVARALVSGARVVVFDEPTSVLTERDVQRLFDVIGRLRSRGLAVIYISHFLEEVQRLADRYTVLRDGQSVATGSMAGTALSAIVTQMIGRPLTEMFPNVPHTPGDPVVAVDSLAGKRLPKHASLELRRGEVVGVAGLIGAGRTELLRCLFGLDAVRDGAIRVAGREHTRASPRARIREQFGLLSEDRKGEGLALSQTIEDNLTYSRLDFYSLFGWLRQRQRRRAAAGWMRDLRVVAQGPLQAVGALSGGNQQKVAIGRLLHQQAEVLLLDEPTRGIDVGSKVEIYRLIGQLAARGTTVLVVSSYLPELLGICDRIAVMRRGVIAETRETSAWTEHEILSVATGA